MPIRPPDAPDSPASDRGFLARWSRVKSGAGGKTAGPAPGGGAPPLPAPPGAAADASPTADSPPSPAAAAGPANALPHASTGPTPPTAPPPPTLEEAAALQPGTEVSRFMARDVAPDVRHAALKQLFADPAFNVMDGLDTYIDDYGRPDPLPASWLRKMASAASLNLFSDDDDAAAGPVAVAAADAAAPADDAASAIVAAAPPSPPSESPAHEDPDLRLQPDDADRPPGPGAGTGADPGRER